MFRQLTMIFTIFSLTLTPVMANDFYRNDVHSSFRQPEGYVGFYLKIPLQKTSTSNQPKFRYGLTAELRNSRHYDFRQPWRQAPLNSQPNFHVNLLALNMSDRGFETLNFSGAAIFAGQDNLTFWQLEDAKEGDQKSGGGSGLIIGGAVVLGLLVVGGIQTANGIEDALGGAICAIGSGAVNFVSGEETTTCVDGMLVEQ